MKVTHENIIALLKSHADAAKHSVSSALRLIDSQYPFYGLMTPGIYLHSIEDGDVRSTKLIPLATLSCYNDVRLDGKVLIFDNVLAINFGET